MKIVTDKLLSSVDSFLEENEKLAMLLFAVVLALKFMNFNDKRIDSTISKVNKKGGSK